MARVTVNSKYAVVVGIEGKEKSHGFSTLGLAKKFYEDYRNKHMEHANKQESVVLMKLVVDKKGMSWKEIDRVERMRVSWREE